MKSAEFAPGTVEGEEDMVGSVGDPKEAELLVSFSE